MKRLSREELIEALSHPIFHTIGEVADQQGVECYVVGGYVRDLFLQRPSKDIDVVVVGSGIEMASALGKRLGKGAHVSLFRNFGTAQVKWKNHEIEFVGARRESYQRDSRKPIVEDGTLEDDQNRRDFTINAMAICLNAERFGELVDPFNGVWDLEDRIIATPLDPDITFSDDPLRMMRCIRFATQLNFTIEPETFEALQRNKERIKIISAERIIDELQKIMASNAPSMGFELLFQSGLLEIIFPELYALQGTEQIGGRAHKDNFWHTLTVLSNVVRAQQTPQKLEHLENLANLEHLTNLEKPEKPEKPGSPENSAPAPSAAPAFDKALYLRWAALLHDIGKPRTKRFDAKLGWTFHNHNYIGAKMILPIFRRLKLPLDERMHYVEKLVELHMRPINIADEEVTDSAVRRLLFEAGDDIEDLMTLCEADITSRNQEKKQRFLDNFKLVREKLVDLEERDRIRCFQPPVGGDEIMAYYHIPPCNLIGTLKSAIKDAILDGLIPNDHDAAFEFMKTQAAALGLKAPDTDF